MLVLWSPVKEALMGLRHSLAAGVKLVLWSLVREALMGLSQWECSLASAVKLVHRLADFPKELESSGWTVEEEYPLHMRWVWSVVSYRGRGQ